MARFSFALAGVSALAIAALPAVAQAQDIASIHGTIAGQYSNLSVDSLDADAWSGDVGVVYNGGMGLGGQANLGFGTAELDGSEADLRRIGGAVQYRAESFKLGGGVQYQTIDFRYYSDTNLTSYGLAGEAYLGDTITFAGRGGSFGGEFGGGKYIGAGAAIYPIPNLAVKGDFDFVDPKWGPSATAFGGAAEFLPMSTIPVAITGGYRYVDDSGDQIDVWHIGLKAYLGTPGTGTLVDNHRNGALNMGNVYGTLLGQ